MWHSCKKEQVWVGFFFVSCFYRNTECSLWFQHSFRPLIALPSVTITYSNVKLCIWTDTVLTLLLLSSLYLFQHKSLSPILFVTFGSYLFIYLSNRVFVPLVGLKSSGGSLIAKSIF